MNPYEPPEPSDDGELPSSASPPERTDNPVITQSLTLMIVGVLMTIVLGSIDFLLR